MRVTVLGAGYVGLVSGACLASWGHRVSVRDTDAERIRVLESGRSPIFEPGLHALMRECRSAGTLSFASRGGMHADIVLVAVGTPPTVQGSADLSQVRQAVSWVATASAPGTTVVMKSTVPPGTGVALASQLAPRGIGYVSNPEFLREGSAVADFLHTDRLVVGASDPGSAAAVRELYATLQAPVVECDITSAEMIKYASNAFLATKVSFINEIAKVCELLGADVIRVAEGVGHDARIGRAFLDAGIGYGGSCFPKDTRALDFVSSAEGHEFHLLKTVIEVNAAQRMLPVRTLKRMLGGLEGMTAAVLGLAFKPNTDDTRESPSLDIIRMLASEGCTVLAHDPVASLPPNTPALQAASAHDALDGADAAVVAVAWDEYRQLRWAECGMARDGVVFDGRNCLDPQAVTAAGYHYVGVGRPAAGAGVPLTPGVMQELSFGEPPPGLS